MLSLLTFVGELLGPEGQRGRGHHFLCGKCMYVCMCVCVIVYVCMYGSVCMVGSSTMAMGMEATMTTTVKESASSNDVTVVLQRDLSV